MGLGACGPDSSGKTAKLATVVPAPTPAATHTPNPAVASACVPSGAMAIDVNSANSQVSVYAPAGDWTHSVTGVLLVPVESGG